MCMLERRGIQGFICIHRCCVDCYCLAIVHNCTINGVCWSLWVNQRISAPSNSNKSPKRLSPATGVGEGGDRLSGNSTCTGSHPMCDETESRDARPIKVERASPFRWALGDVVIRPLHSATQPSGALAAGG